MTTHRIPFWLSPFQFNELSSFLSICSLGDNIALLEEIRIELGVAKLRAMATSINLNSLTSVLGLALGSTPIHLSTAERDFLLELENLPESIRIALS